MQEVRRRRGRRAWSGVPASARRRLPDGAFPVRPSSHLKRLTLPKAGHHSGKLLSAAGFSTLNPPPAPTYRQSFSLYAWPPYL
jgi:hypothetical protein